MKKYLRVLGIGSVLTGLVLGLDMLAYGSVFHPLTYLYNGLSWLECKNSQKQSCNNTAPSASRSPVSAQNGMVFTEQHLASEVGLQILQKGGNAVDAAVGVGYALAVTDPCCGNIGGGGFMLIHQTNGKETFINFREKAPGKATQNMYLFTPLGTWGASESILVSPLTGLKEGANDSRRPAGEAVGY